MNDPYVKINVQERFKSSHSLKYSSPKNEDFFIIYSASSCFMFVFLQNETIYCPYNGSQWSPMLF